MGTEALTLVPAQPPPPPQLPPPAEELQVPALA
jgi:hypothetical protein